MDDFRNFYLPEAATLDMILFLAHADKSYFISIIYQINYNYVKTLINIY